MVLFYNDYKMQGVLLVWIVGVYLLAFLIVLALCHFRRHHDKLWIPLAMKEIIDIPLFYFLSLPLDDLLVEEGSEAARSVLGICQGVVIILFIGWLENTFIFFNAAET